jgi:hypothetical protein
MHIPQLSENRRLPENFYTITIIPSETVPKYTLEAKFYDKFIFYEKERIAIREASHFC